jgi:cytochrome c-type biogenesis protein CcmH
VKRVDVFVSVCVGLLAGLCLVATVSAQTPTPGSGSSPDDVNRVASKLYCPVCENEPLDVCQTAACVQWKAQIGQFLAEGKTDEEIVQIFVQRFGLRVQGEPPLQGITLLLYILPIVALLAGGAFSVVLIRRLSKRGASAPISSETPSTTNGDEYHDQVERDLKQNL